MPAICASPKRTAGFRFNLILRGAAAPSLPSLHAGRGILVATYKSGRQLRRAVASAVGAGAARGSRGEWERRRAEAAFGRHPADIPVGPAAAGAVVHLVLVIDDAIAAVARIVRQGLDPA